MIQKEIISEITEKDFEEFLKSKIMAFNNDISPFHEEARKPGAFTPINIILKDIDNNYIGGLTATTYWGWLDIDKLYIPEESRGKGIGLSMLKTAESIAIKRGCKSAFLSTYEFQARSFYEEYGYYITGKLEDYPPGSTFYWMRKDF